MSKARVPCGPILNVGDLVEEPQFQARGMFEKASPPEGAEHEMILPAILPVLHGTPVSDLIIWMHSINSIARHVLTHGS